MKMITAIVQDKDANGLNRALVKHGFRATRLASSGSFLRSGNTTFLIGTEDNQLAAALEQIKEACKTRTEIMAPSVSVDLAFDAGSTGPIEVQIGGATVFVQDVEAFYHF